MKTKAIGCWGVMLVVGLSALSGCASWHPVMGSDLRAGIGRIFVATATEAVLLDVSRVDAKRVYGRKVRGWTLPAGTVLPPTLEESPLRLARNAGWAEQSFPRGVEVSIELAAIRTARLFQANRGKTVALAVGIPLGVAAAVGLGFLLISAFFVACGRPLRVRGKRVITPTQRGNAWGDALQIQPVPDEVRSTLIDIWTQEAQAEHAAIAAFSKLSLELLALGAPPELVAGANRAAIQEVEHARLCFSLASAYRGEPLTAAPLPQALEGDTVCLNRLARESLLDGCVREGIAAVIARLGAERALDPEVARVMRVQAKEEAQHAKLGWAIVEWCLQGGGEEMRRALLKALGEAELPRCDDLPDHGRIGRVTIKPHFDALCAQARERIEGFGVALAA